MEKEYNADQIATRLKELRKQHRLSQQDVVDCIGISRNTYVKMEGGNLQDVRLSTLIALARIYHKDVGYLLCEHDGHDRTTADLSKEIGISSSAVTRLIHNRNLANITNYFLCSETIHHLCTCINNYCHKAAEYTAKHRPFLRKDLQPRVVNPTFYNAAELNNEDLILSGLNWRIHDEFTQIIKTIYDLDTHSGNYQELLQGYSKDNKDSSEHNE